MSYPGTNEIGAWKLEDLHCTEHNVDLYNMAILYQCAIISIAYRPTKSNLFYSHILTYPNINPTNLNKPSVSAASNQS